MISHCPTLAYYRSYSTYSSIDAVRQSRVLHYGDPLVGSVRVFEEHHSRPVVREVFGECTGSASTFLSEVPSRRIHRCVKGIATNYLVKVC